MKETLRQCPTLDTNSLKIKEKQTGTAAGALTKALVECAVGLETGYAQDTAALRRALRTCWGRTTPTNLAEFYCPAVRQAVALFIGEEGATRTERLLALRRETIYSASPFRRSYHSASFAEAIPQLELMLVICAAFPFYGLSPAQATEWDTTQMTGFSWHLALALREGDDAARRAVREAMLGDNSRVLLTAQIIRAVVISADGESVALLGKLLLAAQLQEGLRQQILENMDWGSKETTLYFLRLIRDNGLTRFSSVVRALDTWTGLGCESVRPQLAERCIRLAINVLETPAAMESYSKSRDALELYFFLWGSAVTDIHRAETQAETLLTFGERHQRMTAAYFLSRVGDDALAVRTALRHLDERDEEVLAWVLRLLGGSGGSWDYLLWRKDEVYENTLLPTNSKERRQAFDRLEAVADFIGEKKRTFFESVFPWASVTLAAAPAVNRLLSLTLLSREETMLERLLHRWNSLAADQRSVVLLRLLEPQKQPAHRELLLSGLADRSTSVRQRALEQLSALPLTEGDIARLCDALSTKSSDYRQKIVTLLATQTGRTLTLALERLLGENDQRRFQGGLSLLLAVRRQQRKMTDPLVERLKQRDASALEMQSRLLLEQLTGQTEDWTEDNGFGLYDPKDACFQPQPLRDAEEKLGLLALLTGKDRARCAGKALRQVLCVPESDVLMLFQKLRQVLLDHADYEYETEHWDGSRARVLLGDADFRLAPVAGSPRGQGDRLEHYPFWEEFLAAAGPYADDTETLSCLLARVECGEQGELALWFQKWLAGIYNSNLWPMLYQTMGRQASVILQLLQLIFARQPEQERFCVAFDLYTALMDDLGQENWSRHYCGNLFDDREQPACTHALLRHWRGLALQSAVGDADFMAAFLRLRYENLTVKDNCEFFDLEHYLRAFRLGLIPEAVMLQQLTTGHHAVESLRQLTDRAQHWRRTEQLEKYPELKEWMRQVVDRVVTLEGRRGELPTPLTPCVAGIKRIEGAEYLIMLLKALGKDGFYRGYDFYVPENKRACLSALIKHCWPEKTDTAQTLAALVRQAEVKTDRLIQTAMYAPQWAGLLEEVTGWTGLKSGVWLFHAHINESYSAEKETEVAVYSPVTPQQFNDGTFDKDWFLSAYHTLGETRFTQLYRSAKYITSGSNQHRRSQLYADAVLGRLDAQALLADIRDKRNQEKLRAWALLPLRDEEEALQRYEYIRQFEKESRQFGTLRRDSEKKSSRAALENLALTMDCADVDRMLWRLEGQKLETLRPLLEPREIGGATLALVIDSDGVPGLSVQKDGKTLKSLPAALKKQEKVVALQKAVKDLTTQRTRAQHSLESAMVTESLFRRSEAEGLLSNPVLGPLAGALLWRSGDAIGLPALRDGKLFLTGANGEQRSTGEDLYIAHPHDLAQRRCWADWQRAVFQTKLIQPFKQVFREYYPLTAEERAERMLSRRYAGHQVQPKRAAALLRSRGWTVDYGTGLQKVCYQENLIVRIFAIADWFTPAEVEPPTLEEVRFFDRTTGEIKPLGSVPPVTFSEAMRDLDLMVSVAHAGGVDPETSHSTVEMRTALTGELLALLGVSNVELMGSHAKITGKLGRYSVHLGSGVTHKEGMGSLLIRPVHSQSRGRIFLPFADDDPKTAEILSIILLLAEDGKVKDPSILQQIGMR